MKILIIDDDILFARLMIHFLESRFFTVDHAPDGSSGLQKFEAARPDLVLCDLNMPGMTGFEVVQKLHKISEATPLIVISSADRIQDAVEAMKAGAWDYIQKPVENMSLVLDALAKARRKASLIKENGMLRLQLEKLARVQDRELTALNAEMRALSSAIEFGFCGADAHLQITRHSNIFLRLINHEDQPIINRTLGEVLQCKVQNSCLTCEYDPCPFRRVLAENSPLEVNWTLSAKSIKLKIMPVTNGEKCDGTFVMAESNREEVIVP